MGFLAYFEVNLDFKEQFLPILKSRLISKGNLNFFTGEKYSHPFHNVSLVSSEESVNIIILNKFLLSHHHCNIVYSLAHQQIHQ